MKIEKVGYMEMSNKTFIPIESALRYIDLHPDYVEDFLRTYLKDYDLSCIDDIKNFDKELMQEFFSGNWVEIWQDENGNKYYELMGERYYV